MNDDIGVLKQMSAGEALTRPEPNREDFICAKFIEGNFGHLLSRKDEVSACQCVSRSTLVPNHLLFVVVGVRKCAERFLID